MTDREKLPTKTTTGNVVVLTEQSGGLVVRGLEAIKSRQELKPDVLKERADAITQYRTDAEQGDAEAQFTFAEWYYEGHGASQEGRAKIWAIHQAVKWWHKAAEQGFPPAQNRLGWAYSHGEGVQKDYVKAYVWLTLAWDSNIHGRFNQSVHYPSSSSDEQRDYIIGFMSPAEIAEAQRLAREWTESHAS